MIFVTVGTTEFSLLVQVVDGLSQNLPEEVVMQIGRGSYEPKNCEYFRFAPSLTPYYKQASVVISHGGVGTITEVLQHGCPLVAVEDVNQPERHQREILEVLAQDYYLIWCKDLQKLPEAIEQAKTQLKPYVIPECQIHTSVTKFLDSLK